jgi:hypothetical protein
MTKYRLKLPPVEAAQWFKNGDHPEDYVGDTQGFDHGEVRNFPGDERRARGWEGNVVRYFRHPDIDGATPCEACGAIMHDHGWIDQGEYGRTVCPGDWVITEANGRRHACKPNVFEARFELLPL